MRYDLQVRDEAGEPVMRAVWETGEVRFEVDVPLMQQAIDRWKRLGLREWVNVPDRPTWRVTRTNDAMFLPRLADYLRSQSLLRAELHTDDEGLARRDVVVFRQRLHQQASSTDAQQAERDISLVRLPGLPSSQHAA